jgi:hypothetical protein
MARSAVQAWVEDGLNEEEDKEAGSEESKDAGVNKCSTNVFAAA